MPTMLYQLLLQAPLHNADYWAALLGPDRCALADVHFSKGYLDFVLLLPSQEPDNGVPKKLLCQIIDAKARDTVKLGAKVQVSGSVPLL